jgi:TRAP-type C4-dicarboxylate transport system permease small subunit
MTVVQPMTIGSKDNGNGAPISDAPLRRRVRDLVLLLPKILLTGLLALAIGDMIVGVFLRYVVVKITDWLDLDTINFFWVEEVGEYTLAWLTLIGAGIAVSERAHFALRVLTHRLPLPTQRAIHVVTHLLIAGFGGLAVWYGIQLAIVNSALTSPALQLNLAWLYAAVPVGGGLIVLYAVATAFAPPEASEAELLVESAAAAGDD